MTPRATDKQPRPDASADPDVIAERLRRVSAAAADELTKPSAEPLRALAAAIELVEVAGQAQRTIFAAARDRGASWSTVGGILGITRQAAYQRFGQGSTKSLPSENIEYADAAAVSLVVLAELQSGQWDAVMARSSGVIRADLGAEGLRQAWQITTEGAEVTVAGPTRVRRVGAVTIAETGLHATTGEQLMRLTFNHEGLIVGIWFDHPAARATRPES